MKAIRLPKNPKVYIKEIDNLQKENKTLENESATLTKDNERLKGLEKTIETLKSKSATLTKDNERLKGLEKTIETLKSENRMLKSENILQRAKISQEVAATDPVQNERNAKLKEENDDVQNKRNTKLKEENVGLKKENTKLKAEKERLEQQNAEQQNKIAEKADKADLVALRLRLENLQRFAESGEFETKTSYITKYHNFSTCLFLCAILLFNIFAIWFIACRPAVSDATGIRELPWMFLLFLCATLAVNIVWAIIVSYRAVRAGKQRAWVGISAAIVLLVLNMVAVWLFAFHPVELTAAVYALLVFLMVANIAEGAAAIFYSYGNENGYVPSIFTFIALLPVLIIFIGWIRA